MGKRIGIIGAGLAGLYNARKLQAAGHEVMILERSERPFGKCYSKDYGTGLTYVGGGVLTPDYTNILRFLRTEGIKVISKKPGMLMGEDGRILSMRSEFWKPALILRNLHGLARFIWAGIQCRRPLDQVPERFFKPISQVPELGRFDNIKAMLDMVLAIMGYGYWDEAPAYQVLRYCMHPKNLLGVCVLYFLFHVNVLKYADGGFLRIAETLAKGLLIKTNARILSIKRDNEVTVQTEDGTYVFDELIIACPLDSIAGVLDCTAEERKLARAVINHHYTVVMARLEDYPRRSVYVRRPYDGKSSNELGLINNDQGATDIATSYIVKRFQEPPLSVKDQAEKFIRDVRILGYGVKEVVDVKTWKYFPHFKNRESIALLESIQGKNNTLYVGGLTCFELTEAIMRKSDELLEKHFGIEPVRESFTGIKNLIYYFGSKREPARSAPLPTGAEPWGEGAVVPLTQN
jgi:hypothetical protein